jgi:peroxiredoxin (alkyl hydroperoxide reductase subunit C)
MSCCDTNYFYPQVLVGQEAPDFTAAAVLGSGEIVDNFNFKEVTKGKYAVVFFYPLDFTFVCPSELIAFDHRLADFKAKNVEVIGVSIDSHFTHAAWRNTPVNQGGIGQVGYPLVADIKHEICQSFGVEAAGGCLLYTSDAAGDLRDV